MQPGKQEINIPENELGQGRWYIRKKSDIVYKKHMVKRANLEIVIPEVEYPLQISPKITIQKVPPTPSSTGSCYDQMSDNDKVII